MEEITCNPWDEATAPERILIIRLHAIGDVAITLPLCAALRKMLPDTRIDFLTGQQSRDLPEALSLFDTVHVFPDSRSLWARAVHAVRSGAALAKIRYDLVIDLQRNWVSRAIRRICMPRSWSEFDRFSPLPAGERVRQSFRAAGFPEIAPEYALPVSHALVSKARERLLSLGWDGVMPLVCLNPAGFWKTRNWPLDHYAALGSAILNHRQVTIVLLGNGRISESGRRLTEKLPSNTINLVDQTTLIEAFAIVQLLSAMVSDDSGLMHMAWNSGIPTVALFGSSRHDWSAPLGPHSRMFHSGDLECGACMHPECAFGDIHCLTRFSSEIVLNAVLDSLKQQKGSPAAL